jgi:regulator of protease activity HflC (stomatin/prohibitin superfamily)
MFTLIIIFLCIIGIGIAIIGKFSENSTVFVAGLLTGGLTLILFIFQFFTIIDAGEVGIQVRFGAVLEGTLNEGINVKDPFASIYTYSVRVQQYTMSYAEKEGQGDRSDAVQAWTKDNSLALVDGTLLWRINPDQAFEIYKKTAKNLNTLIELIIRPALRNAIYDTTTVYTLENLMQNREKFGEEVKEKLMSRISEKGVIVDNMLIRRITPPQKIDDAIQQKLQAQQELQRKEFELEKAKKDAEIRRVAAQGIADAQEIIQKKLTPLYVQYEAIQAYKDLADSNNTTFVIMPTSPNGAGMPLILNAR